MENKKIKLKAGDILGFELDTEEFKFNKKYGFAKVLIKTKLGDAIEVYDHGPRTTGGLPSAPTEIRFKYGMYAPTHRLGVPFAQVIPSRSIPTANLL
jgi:hypothetical protein